MTQLRKFYHFVLSYRGAIATGLYIIFFLTLIFTPNHINSKVLVLLAIFSLSLTGVSALKLSWKLNYPLILLFLWMLFSLIYSQDLEMGLDKVQRAVILPVSILIFSGMRISEKEARRIFSAFTILVFIACIYSHTITIAEFVENKETELRSLFNLNYSYLALGSTLDLHPTYYAFIIISAILLLLDQLWKQQAVWSKILLGIGITYLSLFVIHLSSRIGIVILYLLILYQILDVFIKKKALFRGLIVLVGFHAVLFVMISQIGITKYRLQHVFGFEYYTGYKVNDGSHKIALWKEAIAANDQILFGNGIGDVGASLRHQYLKAGLDRPAEKRYNSHNQYIEYYVGTGIIGVSLFLYLLYFYFRSFRKSHNLLGNYFIAALALFCMTECMWNRHHGIVFSVIMIGILQFLNSENQVLAQEPMEPK